MCISDSIVRWSETCEMQIKCKDYNCSSCMGLEKCTERLVVVTGPVNVRRAFPTLLHRHLQSGLSLGWTHGFMSFSARFWTYHLFITVEARIKQAIFFCAPLRSSCLSSFICCFPCPCCWLDKCTNEKALFRILLVWSTAVCHYALSDRKGLLSSYQNTMIGSSG